MFGILIKKHAVYVGASRRLRKFALKDGLGAFPQAGMPAVWSSAAAPKVMFGILIKKHAVSKNLPGEAVVVTVTGRIETAV
jgi:hypothetical protein